jgi:hypothetical protein
MVADTAAVQAAMGCGVNLLDARAKLAAALAPIEDTDPTVLVDLVDALEPPALMLGWGEPWLQPQTSCLRTGRLVITAVAGRLVPGAGIETLEQLVDYTLGTLAADDGPWPLDSVSGPRVFTLSNINYLAARIVLRVPIQGGP